MATSGEGSSPGGRAGPRPLAQLQELEPRVARRRLSQARHRATLAGLFNILRKTVYSQSDLTASKVWGTRVWGGSVSTCGGTEEQSGDWSGTPTHPPPALRAGAWVGQRSAEDTSPWSVCCSLAVLAARLREASRSLELEAVISTVIHFHPFLVFTEF